MAAPRRGRIGKDVGIEERETTAESSIIGEVYLRREEIAGRVRELGQEIARDYQGREPILVAPLKASVVFLADLSRALQIPHTIDFVELAGFSTAALGGQQRIRLLKDLDVDVTGRELIVVEDVVDTGLTLNYLTRVFALRAPTSITIATLFDRPYRRLVDDLPVRYVGFTVPDELFAGYGFDLNERFRNLPDIHLTTGS
ncbi:MAG: phosphoribosyltransferase [Gaiellaceae bacterium]